VDTCCDPPAQPPAAPLRPYNPPGLSAIAYRIGTFSSFRQAMLDDVARPNLLYYLVDAEQATPNPFERWRAGAEGDYHTMLIELWAYLADILTFYQERIANEAYLPTATQRDSSLRLAELIGYRPSPGAAASALVAFTVAKDKAVTIAGSFRVGSRATPERPAAVFETAAAITALGAHSAIPLSARAPTNQFAALSDLQAVAASGGVDDLALAQAATNVYGPAGAIYLHTFSFGMLLGGLGATATTSRSVVLAGIDLRLAAGDYVLVVENENEGADVEQKTLQRIDKVTPDKTAGTTTITWSEEPGLSYANVTLYALRVTAAPFGSNAPAWASLPATLTNSDGRNSSAPFLLNWDLRPTPEWRNDNPDTNHPFYLPTPDQTGDFLFLDSIYDAARGTLDNPGRVALVTDGEEPKVFRFTDARPASIAYYAISGRVTRLTLDVTDEPLPDDTFPLRNTVILTGAELLPMQNLLPLPDPLTGNTLILDGLYPDLQAGQQVIVSGQLYDPTTVPPSQVSGAEDGILADPPVLDQANNLTTVTLKSALRAQYARAGAVLRANVVEATQGETVKNEILGSSDGSAFQAYTLKKSPLTYLPSTSAEGLAASESTLQVMVNSVQWAEQPTLLESAPNDRAYTTAQDDAGKTSVSFGDGINGARPPTGRNNISARYRKGLGTSGNVESGAIQQLIDSASGLQQATNPLKAAGGADPEGLDEIQANAPARQRTIGRAVSAADYAALALSYPGVGKASAAWVLRDPLTLKAIAHPYIQLTVATGDGSPLADAGTLLANLRAFLDARRDPNVSLRIGDYTPVYVEVAATIDILDAYPRQGTLDKVQAALNPGVNPDGTAGFFAFESLDFGQSIHLSAVYAALQSVEGVSAATITVLRRLTPPNADTDPTAVRGHIFIRPGELAVIANDPTDPGKGALTLSQGQGGYVDT
jgi:predicted phage baseplate assembly protein